MVSTTDAEAAGQAKKGEAALTQVSERIQTMGDEAVRVDRETLMQIYSLASG